MVSVIVPVYNAGKYLNKCVESLREQTYRDLEIILIDDGSVDGSGGICDKYAQEDPRIVVFHQKNKGVSAARNKGLEISKGDYISFVDSDDWVHKEYIEHLVDALNAGADLAICSMQELTARTVDESAISGGQFIHLSKKECFQKMLHSLTIGGFLWNKLFKKNLILQTLREGLYYSEDFVFCAQYVENINQITFINLPLYYYWKNPNSATSKYGEYNDKFFSLLEAELILREIYIRNVPETAEDITVNLLKVALNLRARYKYNKVENVEQYQALEKVIGQYYPDVMNAKTISFQQKVNIFLTKRFPVLFLRLKSILLRRSLKR